ncbi:hypothetical protein LCGC14_0621890 [marine sediment metagenome]|uniref:YopX protein domain-containing protein n=1 Tax=marine sediment metagenome TaxID=412755 RepID=A0A0F9RNU5_9ZZZZ
MKETKFRVWDKHYERWEERPCAINKKGKLFIYNADSGEWFEPQHTAYEVEWYTGLKDKTGTEIYEADIVRRRTTHSQPILIVKWGETGWNPFEDDLCNLGSVAYYEVIGNIHENPEILEKRNGLNG